MIPEIGQFALILAFVMALVQGTLPVIGAARNNEAWMAVARPAALAQLFFIALAFFALTWSFVVSDFSVLTVADNSSLARPLLYKITGVWGNHKGSMMLWVLILAIYGGAVAIFSGHLPRPLRARVLSVQAWIAVGFLLFILLVSNPFVRVFPPPANGNGLNPLLQDPGLATHPPALYMGYVGFSMAFSFAIAALIEGRVDPAWARWVRPWVLVAWCFLTLGIALGSHWSYYVLGWGGWWFWDPVENASFMPWLAGTALLHSAIVVERREALKSWTILLAILTFSLSLIGTFLVRSGVLTSVHAFAVDPRQGSFILILLVVTIGGSLGLYALRAPSLKISGLFAPISREGALVLNNLLLVTACGTILLGTLYPLLLASLTGQMVSVGPPYFNAVFVPIMVPLIALMAIGPMLAWKRGDLGGALSRLKAAFAAAAVIALVTWHFVTRGSWLPVLGMALAAWLIVGSVVELIERLRLFGSSPRQSWSRARHLPRSVYGMVVAHAGLGVVVLGITASLTWHSAVLRDMRPGQSAKVGPYEFTLRGVREVPGPNYTARQGLFTVTEGGRYVTTMKPEVRQYSIPPMSVNRVALRPSLVADLYAAIGSPDGSGGYAVRLYHKPLISWIWLGALIMVVGGGLSLSDRRLRIGAPARKSKAYPVPGSIVTGA